MFVDRGEHGLARAGAALALRGQHRRELDDLVTGGALGLVENAGRDRVEGRPDRTQPRIPAGGDAEPARRMLRDPRIAKLDEQGPDPLVQLRRGLARYAALVE